MDIVTILKALTEARHHVHLGEVKAQAGVKETFLPMLPPSRVVTQRSIDAGGNLNDIPNEDLEVARIDSTCNVSNNVHEHQEWPSYPIPEHKGVDEKEFSAMEVLLEEGTGPDGCSPEERENRARVAPKSHPQAPDACQDGAVDDEWQAKNLKTSLCKALRKSCRLD